VLHRRGSPHGQTATVTPDELRARARAEAVELGPEPSDPQKRELWSEQRRGTVVFLASLAEWNPSMCRQAALEASIWEPFVQRLLLDAAKERG
jgi:hypothetical protein